MVSKIYGRYIIYLRKAALEIQGYCFYFVALITVSEDGIS